MYSKLFQLTCLLTVMIAVESIELQTSFTAFSAVDRDLKITSAEKAKLDKFRKRVESKLPHEYMKGDLYLVRWLRARSFNIDNAEEMLMNNLKWRREQKMDTIHQENWVQFDKLYPITLDTVDKEGKPILYIHPSAWDLRKIALSGDANKFRRHIDRNIDLGAITVRNLQQKYQNVTQGVIIINLDGYNVVQHACVQCIPIILNGLLTYENYYTGLVDKIFVLNTPVVFEPLLQTIRGVLSPPTNRAMKIYGSNKAEWKSVLLKHIHKDQLPVELGGTRKTQEPDY